LLDFLRNRLSELAPSFEEAVSKDLRQPIFRTLLWIGSSVTRESLDDKVVDLCTGLESLLTLEGDPRKAEAIAVRYMLLGFAVDDPSYVTHPFAIYDLYKLRNKVVHGSARRVCDESAYRDLNYVALDAVNRTMKLVSNASNLKRQSDLFDYLESRPHLERAKAFLDGYGKSKRESIGAIGGLLNLWLSRAPLKEIAKENNWIVQWKHEARTTVKFLPKESDAQAATASGYSISASGWDPLKLNLDVLLLFQDHLSKTGHSS
jgi:hypothetical protein